MVGAGTGLAPFRSFWQDRKVDKEMISVSKGQDKKIWGEMIFYFGCRNSFEDELYKKEIEQMVNEGVITMYYPAYSREPNHKKVELNENLFLYLKDFKSFNHFF